MRRILFVDDERYVLDGLANLLHRHRHHWSMVFALGGRAALAELAKAPFDVVVSDMRMPEVDGAALLERVKELHPATARIVLSGHAERDSMLRALPVAHQFLTKPCDPSELRAVVERACELQALLHDDAIRRIVGELDCLPSAPEVYWELARAIDRPSTAMSDIAAIVERDPAMCAKLLQLVNSAYFGLARRVTSIHQAIGYLGTELVRSLALTAQVFSTMRGAPVPGFSVERLQDHSLVSARLAKQLARDPRAADDAFTAALVHDVGKIVLALAFPERYAACLRDAQSAGAPSHVAESAAFGITHAEIGAYLLGVWGLPMPILEAVAYHHAPGRIGEGACDVVAAVHTADALVHARGALDGARLDLAFLERTGHAAELPRWRALAAERLASIER